MKTSLLFAFIFFALLSNAQINNIKIYSDDESSCYLNQINDTLVYMTFEQYPHYDGYMLGRLKMKKGEIVINEISESVSIKKDVYYWDKKEIHEDSLLIEYYLSDYFFNTPMRLKDLKFEINGVEHNPMDNKFMMDSYAQSVVVKRPMGSRMELNILDGEKTITNFQIKLKEGKQAILIKEAVYYSMPAFITDTFEELIPEHITVQNKKYDLRINLTD